MSLSGKIEQLKIRTEALAEFVMMGQKEYVWNHIFQ